MFVCVYHPTLDMLAQQLINPIETTEPLTIGQKLAGLNLPPLEDERIPSALFQRQQKK
jgi:hypothetical protein